MNRLPVKKFILSLSVVFVLGAVTGGSFAWNAASHQHKHRPMPDKKDMTDWMKSFLQSRLSLTPDQVTAIDPFLQEYARDLKAMHTESARNFESIVNRFHANITPLLSPEQRAKLAELDRERRERFKPRPPKSDPVGVPNCRSGPSDPAFQTTSRECFKRKT